MTETESFEPLSSIRIAFFDVGQADTIVITSPETHEAIVVDCVNPKAVLDYWSEKRSSICVGSSLRIFTLTIIVESLAYWKIIIECPG